MPCLSSLQMSRSLAGTSNVWHRPSSDDGGTAGPSQLRNVAPSSSPDRTMTPRRDHSHDGQSLETFSPTTLTSHLQSPDGFISPRHCKDYPISSASADALDARRRALFEKPHGTTAGPSMMRSSVSGPPLLQPGIRHSTPKRPSRAFKQPPSASSSPIQRSPGQSSPMSIASPEDGLQQRLYRQRFRARCQAVMARDQKRSQILARNRRHSRDSSDGVMFGSDDLSSSDREPDEADGEEAMGAWMQQDEELIRRVMLSEYRRLLSQQESSGQRELGWLGADEVAWLEEELQREDAGKGHFAATEELEPPADMVDEEAAAYEQYQHSIAQQLPPLSESQEDEFAHLDAGLDYGALLEEVPVHRSHAAGADEMDLS